ncbi:MAG: hypothetical protein LUF33_03575 [Clostridiales bacterium]|nr:hypothetical protein [Clostridiales bacterium]
MEIFSVVLLVVFAVIGIISLVSDLTYFLFRSKKDSSIMFVTPIGKNCEDAELLLRSAAAKVKWVSRGRNDCVICLDCDMDDETKKICENICREYGFAKLLSKKEFYDMIS